MTRKEAIEILREVEGTDDSIYQYNPKYMAALEMAINSLEMDEIFQLEYERTTNKDLAVEAEDCISRKAVLDMLEKWDWQDLYLPICFKENIIDELPSVYPKSEEFQWCTGCKEYDQEKHCCHRYSKVIRDTVKEMKEAIFEDIKAEIMDEKEAAYADFERYKVEYLGVEQDELPDDDFRYGMERALEIFYKHINSNV